LPYYNREKKLEIEEEVHEGSVGGAATDDRKRRR